VAHWVELAERSAFKGQYRRAIDRYKDALFYLNDGAVKAEAKAAGTERIEREIGRLRASLRAKDTTDEETNEETRGGAS